MTGRLWVVMENDDWKIAKHNVDQGDLIVVDCRGPSLVYRGTGRGEFERATILTDWERRRIGADR